MTQIGRTYRVVCPTAYHGTTPTGLYGRVVRETAPSSGQWVIGIHNPNNPDVAVEITVPVALLEDYTEGQPSSHAYAPGDIVEVLATGRQGKVTHVDDQRKTVTVDLGEEERRYDPEEIAVARDLRRQARERLGRIEAALQQAGMLPPDHDDLPFE